MRSIVFILFILFILLSSTIVSADENKNLQTMDAVILVTDRFEAADDLEKWAESKEGYLISRSRDQIKMRIPGQFLGEFVDFIESMAEEIVQIKQQSKDISQNLLEMEASIRSKEELFKQAVKLFDQSDFATTFEIENEILAILSDIEKLNGRYKKLQGEGFLALIKIDFRLHEEKVPESLPSAFPWINTVDFYQLIDQFNRY